MSSPSDAGNLVAPAAIGLPAVVLDQLVIESVNGKSNDDIKLRKKKSFWECNPAGRDTITRRYPV